MVCSGFLKKFEETGQVGDQSSGAMTVYNNNNNNDVGVRARQEVLSGLPDCK